MAISTIPQTETAEIYRRALEGRAIGAVRRTPGLNDQVAASHVGKHPAEKKAERKSPRLAAATAVGMPAAELLAATPARAIGMPDSRRSVWPTLLVVGAAVYGLYWYGAQKPSGSARDVSDAIASVARTVSAPVMPYLNRIRASATVPTAADSLSASSGNVAPVPPSTDRRRASKGAPAPGAERANGTKGAAVDSTARDSVTRDSTATRKPSTDTTKPPS
jgi:hypothetical protein